MVCIPISFRREVPSLDTLPPYRARSVNIGNLEGFAALRQARVIIESQRARCCTQFKNSSPPNEKSNALIKRQIDFIFGASERSISSPNSVSLSEEEQQAI